MIMSVFFDVKCRLARGSASGVVVVVGFSGFAGIAFGVAATAVTFKLGVAGRGDDIVVSSTCTTIRTTKTILYESRHMQDRTKPTKQ